MDLIYEVVKLPLQLIALYAAGTIACWGFMLRRADRFCADITGDRTPSLFATVVKALLAGIICFAIFNVDKWKYRVLFDKEARRKCVETFAKSNLDNRYKMKVKRK